MSAVLDVYDDGGNLLADFEDKLPESVKMASVPGSRDLERLPDDLFALVLVKSAEKHRKFPIDSPASTLLSGLYFVHTYRGLPPNAVKLGAKNLMSAMDLYGLEIPHQLSSLAKTGGLPDPESVTMLPEDSQAAANEVEALFKDRHLNKGSREKEDRSEGKQADLTGTDVMPVGQKPKKPKDVKKLSSVFNETPFEGPTVNDLVPLPRLVKHAALGGSGEVLFPLETFDDVMAANSAFDRVHEIPVTDRVKIAEALKERSADIGIPMSKTAAVYVGEYYRDPHDLVGALVRREEVLERLGKEGSYRSIMTRVRKSCGPRDYAEKLAELDRRYGLDELWDTSWLGNPWTDTLSAEKIASVVYTKGEITLTDEDLERLSTDRAVLSEILEEDIVNEFSKSPVSVFKSLPDPLKKTIGRLAMDKHWRGQDVK